MESPEAEVPEPLPLIPHRMLPYHIIADGGFGLKEYVLTPFPLRSADTPEKRYYNYRLSRYVFFAKRGSVRLRVINCAVALRHNISSRAGTTHGATANVVP